MSRDDVVRSTAPTAPPCWPDRLSWVEYLVVADSVRSNAITEQPFVRVRGEIQPNREFCFCADCTGEFRDEMLAAGRCRPKHLLEL